MKRVVEVGATDTVEGGLNIHLSAKLDDGTEALISFLFTDGDVRIEARNPFDGSIVRLTTSNSKSYFGDAMPVEGS